MKTLKIYQQQACNPSANRSQRNQATPKKPLLPAAPRLQTKNTLTRSSFWQDHKTEELDSKKPTISSANDIKKCGEEPLITIPLSTSQPPDLPSGFMEVSDDTVVKSKVAGSTTLTVATPSCLKAPQLTVEFEPPASLTGPIKGAGDIADPYFVKQSELQTESLLPDKINQLYHGSMRRVEKNNELATAAMNDNQGEFIIEVINWIKLQDKVSPVAQKEITSKVCKNNRKEWAR